MTGRDMLVGCGFHCTLLLFLSVIKFTSYYPESKHELLVSFKPNMQSFYKIQAIQAASYKKKETNKKQS